MSRSNFAIRHSKNVQKSTESLFLPFYGPCTYTLSNIVWTFCTFNLKNHYLSFSFSVGSFCSRSECEKRKAIWDACVADIKQDPGQEKDFDTQMVAVMNQMGQ